MTRTPDSGSRFQLTTHSTAETQQLARDLGVLIQSPLVIAMTGGLGSGKTTFVQGLGRGLGVPEAYLITSPTFTLVNEYPGRLKLYHVDLYRIDDPNDTQDMGLFEIMRSDGVVAIEWAEHIEKELPPQRMDVGFEMVGDESRALLFRGYGSPANNLLNRIKSGIEESA